MVAPRLLVPALRAAGRAGARDRPRRRVPAAGDRRAGPHAARASGRTARGVRQHLHGSRAGAHGGAARATRRRRSPIRASRKARTRWRSSRPASRRSAAAAGRTSRACRTDARSAAGPGAASAPRRSTDAVFFVHGDRLIHVKPPGWRACQHLRDFPLPAARPSRARSREAPLPRAKHGCPMTPARSMRRACAVLSFLAICAWPAVAAAAPAAASPPAPNDTCLMCHTDKDAKSSAGKSIAVDADRFKKSVHGELQLKCTDCHADVSAQKLPHGDKLKPVNCGTCHEKAVSQYAGTVHGMARKGGNAVAANCTDCHGTHDILRAKDPASPINHANVEKTCSTCHGSDADRRAGQAPRRQRRQQVPRQHPRQGAEGRGAGFGADVHELPRRARHPREGRREEPHQPREHPGNLRHLPQARERGVPRGIARQAAAGRQPGRRPAAPTATRRTASSCTTPTSSRST